MKPMKFIPLLSVFLFACATPKWEADKTYQITILHTNDHHGRFWNNDIGEYGLAAQKTVVDQIRNDVESKGGSLLLLSGGDINTGIPESDLQHAEPDFKGMNLIGYDAMALGNHEFDNPIDILRTQESWATFPLLSANIYDEKTNKRLFKPYTVFNKNGIKIAVIGLTTADTKTIGNPEYLVDIDVRDPAKEAYQLITELKTKIKPDVIIAATHMGHYDDGRSGTNAPGDVEMARSLPQGYLDMIVGGHSQNPVCMESNNVKQADYVPGTPCQPDQQNGTWIVQAHEWGKYVGRADFEFKNGVLTLKHYELIPINLQKEVKHLDGTKGYKYYTHKIAQNPKMLELLTPYQKKGEKQLQVVIGDLNGDLEGDRKFVRYEQMPIGHFTIAAIMEKVNADFGLLNGGAIRDSLNAGKVTYKDVLRIFPFGNSVAYYDIKGDKIPDYIEHIASRSKGSGGYAQFANISFTLDNAGIHDIRIKGQPLDINKTYRIGLLNFSAVGGDGYPNIKSEPTYIDTGFTDADALVEYIKKHSPLNANDYTPTEKMIDNRK